MQINYSKDLNYNPLNSGTIPITEIRYLDHGLITNQLIIGQVWTIQILNQSTIQIPTVRTQKCSVTISLCKKLSVECYILFPNSEIQKFTAKTYFVLTDNFFVSAQHRHPVPGQHLLLQRLHFCIKVQLQSDYQKPEYREHLNTRLVLYIGDLKSKHLNRELIWIENFYSFGIQMVANSISKHG